MRKLSFKDLLKVEIGYDFVRLKDEMISIKPLYSLMLENLIESSYPDYVKDKISIFLDNGENCWLSFEEPIESRELKDHFYIPYLPNYLITKDGYFYNRKLKKYHSFIKSKPYKGRTGGYFYTRGVDLKSRRIQKRHRLLALTFLKYESNPDNLHVNHINGKPGDDNLDNLEWVTPKENLVHAIKNGLMPNSVRKVKIWFFEKNKILMFPSISEAARKLNVTDNLLRHRLKRKYVYYSDKWVPLDIDDELDFKKLKRGVEPLRIKLISDQETLVVDSIEKAAKKLNVSTPTIKKYLKTGKKILKYKLIPVCYKYSCPGSE